MPRSQGVLFHNTANGKVGYHEEGDEKNDGKYEGEIEKGLPNGQGTFTFPNSTQIYVGTFKDGLREVKVNILGLIVGNTRVNIEITDGMVKGKELHQTEVLVKENFMMEICGMEL